MQVGLALRQGSGGSPCNGLLGSAFQICLRPADLTAATKYTSPPSSFSVHQTHHCYRTAQAGNPMLDFNTFLKGTMEPIRFANPFHHSFWNGTTDPNSKWGFYISWSSNGDYGAGTSGNASCSPFQAEYDVEVRTNCVVY
jgi:hypothetical protein